MKAYVGFTGTQHGMTSEQQVVLRGLLGTFVDAASEFHHGDCIGADAEAHEVARELGFFIVIHPPIITAKRAWKRAPVVNVPMNYLERNRVIVRSTQLLIAAPGELEEQLRSGTWSTVRFARKMLRPIYFAMPDGTSRTERTERLANAL